MSKGSPKGSSFERSFSRMLSMWWTGGVDANVFWRTSTSGGRATIRSRKGENLFQQHGDIAAINPIGIPFLEYFTLELKRGYTKDTIADLLDAPENSAEQTYEKWIKQARKSARGADSLSWMMVVKRDKRIPIVFLPKYDWQELTSSYCPLRIVDTYLMIEGKEFFLVGLPLERFFSLVSPTVIRRKVEEYKECKNGGKRVSGLG